MGSGMATSRSWDRKERARFGLGLDWREGLVAEPVWERAYTPYSEG